MNSVAKPPPPELLRGERCIYCEKYFVRGQQGDHIIPAAFGEFEGDVRFHRICPQCNSRVGKSEEQLIRCGPEAVLRLSARVAGHPKRKRKLKRLQGAQGFRAPRVTVNLDGNEQLAMIDHNTGDTYPQDCVVGVDDCGNTKFIPLVEGLTGNALRRQLRSAGIKNLDGIRAHFDIQREHEIRELIRSAGLQVTRELSDTPARQGSAPGTIHTKFSSAYFRAIAKIAFHYAITVSPRRLTGGEQTFAAIRRFIMGHGRPEEFFRTSERMPSFGTPPGADRVHVLAVREVSLELTALVALFVGPEIARPPWLIKLGVIPSSIAIPMYTVAHQFRYFGTPLNGKAGIVEPMNGWHQYGKGNPI